MLVLGGFNNRYEWKGGKQVIAQLRYNFTAARARWRSNSRWLDNSVCNRNRRTRSNRGTGKYDPNMLDTRGWSHQEWDRRHWKVVEDLYYGFPRVGIRCHVNDKFNEDHAYIVTSSLG